MFLHLFCPNRLTEYNGSIVRVDFGYITFSSVSGRRKNLTCRNASFSGKKQKLRHIKTPRILEAILATRSVRGTPLRGWQNSAGNLRTETQSSSSLTIRKGRIFSYERPLGIIRGGDRKDEARSRTVSI